MQHFGRIFVIFVSLTEYNSEYNEQETNKIPGAGSTIRNVPRNNVYMERGFWPC